MHERPLRRNSALLAALLVLPGFLLMSHYWLVSPAALRIEAGLRQDVRQALVESDLPFAAVATDGRRILLSGLVEDPQLRARALDLVQAMPGVTEVVDLMEEPERYVILASIRDGEICLRGVAPSQALALEWQAIAPCRHDPGAGLGVEVSPFTAWVWPGPLLREASKLAQAEIEMSERRVQLRGRNAHPDPERKLESALRGVLPKGLAMDIVVQDVPPLQKPNTEKAE